VKLVRELQARTAELRELERDGASPPELDAYERELEQLRWRLAATVQRVGGDDLPAAA
jgi:hypothetical protein